MDRALNTIKWILLVSLLANAALAGFVVAQMTGAHIYLGPRPQMREMARPGQPAISEKERAILNQAFTAERGNMEAALRELQEARRKTVFELRAPTINGPALDAAMADMRAKTMAAQEIYHRVISAAAPQLTPDERSNLARIFNAAPGRFGVAAVTGEPIPGPGPNAGGMMRREGGPAREQGREQGRGPGPTPPPSGASPDGDAHPP